MPSKAKPDPPGTGDNSGSERWLPIDGHGDYEVSDFGRVRCVAVRRYLKPGDLVSNVQVNTGYLHVCLDGHPYSLHRVVCSTFNGKQPSPKHEVAHNNGVRVDCRAVNLRWATRKENSADIKLHGTENPPYGEMQGRHILTESSVFAIRRMLAGGDGPSTIAPRFGVSRQTISSIAANRNWAYLTASKESA
jgi:hypothetical protein